MYPFHHINKEILKQRRPDKYRTHIFEFTQQQQQQMGMNCSSPRRLSWNEFARFLKMSRRHENASVVT